MRKYRKPQTRVLSIKGEPIMTLGSEILYGGDDCWKDPIMGTDCKQNGMPWEGL